MSHSKYLLPIFSLTLLCPSVTCSTFMGGGVPSPISGHRAVRLHQYIIFIKTRHLFLPHLQLARPPPLIPELYALMLPPAHNCWVAWPPLFCHLNVKNRPHSNILGHTVVTAGDVLPNHPQNHVCQCLTNGGVIPLSVLALRHPDRNPPRHPIM